MDDLVYFYASIAVAVLLALLFSMIGSRELRREAARLRRLNEIMLRGMENSGLVKLSQDPEGNITGLNYNVKIEGVAACGKAGAEFSAEVLKAGKPKNLA